MLIRVLLITLLAAPAALFAQTAPDATSANATETAPRTAVSQTIEAGAQFGTDSDISTKFNEYRDLGAGFRIFNMNLLRQSTDSARFFQTIGRNLGGDDAAFALSAGSYGTWSASLGYDRLPHRFTNDAQSPYSYAGKGVFTVPAVVDILTNSLDTRNFLPVDMLENDRRIDAYLGSYLRQLPEIGTQNNTLSIDLAYAPVPWFEARFAGVAETREGQKITYGPLGDRPPRTMNVEIPEPIDYDESSATFDLAYSNRLFDLTFEFFAPSFENNVDTMRWQSMYFGPDPDVPNADYNNNIILAGDAIVRRSVSTWGQRALAPDNEMTNATVSFGMNTAMSGRLSATVAAGRMRQDATLLPYSFSSLGADWNSTAKLPRLTAEGEIDTLLVDLQYVFNPVRGLRVRPFVRSYEYEIGTPEDHWYYVTQDSASNTAGGSTFMNKRLNHPYDVTRENYGVEATWQARALTVGLTAEQEGLDRAHRETGTDEMILRARASYRPARWLSIRGRMTLGNREGDGYDFRSETGSYWYTSAENGTGTNNPGFSFTNHPDLRRFDVANRERTDLDLSATATVSPELSFSASLSSRRHDFDSDVAPVQPLAGTGFGGQNDTTLGIQLGLLEQNTSRVSFEGNWNPTDRFGANAFVSLDAIDSFQRSMEFNEDRRTTSQAQWHGNPGQAWNDPANLWTADHDDSTTTYGLGINYLFSDRLTLNADYSFARGTVDIAYAGFGADKPLDTTYYGWRNPPTAKHLEHVANLTLDYELPSGFVLGFRYLFNDYSIDDWMQEPEGGWVDVVNPNFVRDSTRDNRWGNRLPRLGGILAPSYNANVGFITLAYRW